MMDYNIAIALIFATGGVVTLALYSVITWCPPQRALSQDTTWGYLGRYGNRVKIAWAAFTLVTASAVLGVYAWMLYVDTDEPGATALAATCTFMCGAIVWPVGILQGSLRVAQVGVVFAAAGSIVLAIYVFSMTSPPVLVSIATVQIVFHHCVIDGLWAVLGNDGASMLGESLLQ